jgi:stage II sporulation protein D
MMLKRLQLIFVLVFFLNPAYPETVLVSLFNDHSLSTIIISPGKGKYELRASGSEPVIFDENQILYVSMIDKYLLLRDTAGTLGLFAGISFSAIDGDGNFSIRPVQPSMEMSWYHGNLELNIDYGRIRIINHVDENLYLAGVVEAESGTGAHQMYYKAHSIICRTYLYGNLKRHADEYFDLCDGVHCQVYKGKLTGHMPVYDAVDNTSGKVIVYGNSGLITAAFHASCGGETVNSEEVWLIPRPYLRSVQDQYCIKRPSATWQRRIDAGEWVHYLKNNGLENGGKQFSAVDFVYLQPGRNIFYTFKGIAIPLRKIRSDWNFRSAFFSIEYSGGQELLFRGRGYGHGVGLCQEGAMEMARAGYNFMEILQFYYTNISITDTGKLF